MDAELKPTEKDIRTVMEAHSLLPEGPLLEEAIEVVDLYADRIRQRLAEFPASVNRHKALLAILEEGFMQEGIIPNNHDRKFVTPGR